MTEGPLLWYLNRGSGVVLLALFTVTVVLGVLSARGRAGGRLPAFVTQAVHRNVSLLALALLVVHVASAVLDEYVDIRWWQAVVPWGSAYQPFWLGLGTVALDLAVVIVATSLVRRRLRPRAWQAVHLLSYAAWALSVAHGLGIGTDTAEPWARWTYVASVGVVLAAAAARPWRRTTANGRLVGAPR